MDITIHSAFLPHDNPDAAEVVQEPVEQPYGIRDCAFRDPAGNLIRIQEQR
jgi:catechol 2,3-dioxygenase-like lactoylglutathione lyase family enzyme